MSSVPDRLLLCSTSELSMKRSKLGRDCRDGVDETRLGAELVGGRSGTEVQNHYKSYWKSGTSARLVEVGRGWSRLVDVSVEIDLNHQPA